jgi:hypothetical protein
MLVMARTTVFVRRAGKMRGRMFALQMLRNTSHGLGGAAILQHGMTEYTSKEVKFPQEWNA